MKTRKIISAIIAGACAISALAIPAAAAGAATSAQSAAHTGIEEITYSTGAKIISPALNVVLPTDAAIVAYLNPYNLDAKDGQKISGGIASPTYKVRNLGGESGVKLTITKAKIDVGTTGASVEAADSGVAAEAATKKIHAYLEGKGTTTKVKYDKSYKYEVESEDNTISWGGTAKAVFSEAGTTNTVLMKLPKADGTTSNKGVFTPTAYSFGEFYVSGVISGETNPELWDPSDAVTLDVVYKITPWNE